MFHLDFQNIKKSFSGREVLKGLSFQVNEGDIVFILGTSGTGKSVLLKNLVEENVNVYFYVLF